MIIALDLGHGVIVPQSRELYSNVDTQHGSALAMKQTVGQGWFTENACWRYDDRTPMLSLDRLAQDYS